MNFLAKTGNAIVRESGSIHLVRVRFVQPVAPNLRWVLLDSRGRMIDNLTQFLPLVSCQWLVSYMLVNGLVCERKSTATMVATFMERDEYANLTQKFCINSRGVLRIKYNNINRKNIARTEISKNCTEIHCFFHDCNFALC